MDKRETQKNNRAPSAIRFKNLLAYPLGVLLFREVVMERICECGNVISPRSKKSKCRRCYKNEDARLQYKLNPKIKNDKNKKYHDKYLKSKSYRLSQLKHKLNRTNKRYGITMIERDKMIVNQNNKCLICGVDFSSIPQNHICIDHNHITGKVRGILCNKCNSGLGMFRDNPGYILKAVEYIKSSESEIKKAEIKTFDMVNNFPF
jgi:hypothetical protein